MDYFHGATLVHGVGVKDKGSVTLGSYIALDNYDLDGTQAVIGKNGYTTMHEYPHYRQSQEYGLLYLFKVGLPSVVGDAKWTEHDANQRATNYFHEVDNSFNWQSDPTSRYMFYQGILQIQNGLNIHYSFLEVLWVATAISYENWNEPW